MKSKFLIQYNWLDETLYKTILPTFLLATENGLVQSLQLTASLSLVHCASLFTCCISRKSSTRSLDL